MATPGAETADMPVIEADPAKIATHLFDTRFAPEPKMAPHQLNAYAETVRAYNLGQGIHSAFVLGNASALNPSAYPSGQVINYKPDAKVDSLTLTPESMHVLVLCKIIAANGQTLNDDFFKAKLDALEEAVPQYSSAPISSEIRNDADNTDDGLWSAELGDTGSTGVLVRRTGNTNDYYIQANCTVPMLGRQFIDDLARRSEAGKAPTWGEMVRSRDFAYWKQATVRQACRVAYAVAEKLGVGIPTINEDGTYRQTIDQAARVTACPTHVQWISSIETSRSGTGDKQRHTVSQYIQCSAADGNSQAYHFVSLGPSEGYAAVKLQVGFRPVAGALPTTTGRVKARTQVEKQRWDPEDATRVAAQCTWEGKGPGGAINDRLHSAAFRAFDDTFVAKNFEQQGWAKVGKRPIEDWHLVTLKIAAPKARPL